MRNQSGAPGAQQVLEFVLTIAVVVSISGVVPEIARAEVEMPGVSKLKLSGEVGLRSEYIRNENFSRRDATREDDNRLRWRARLRLGADYQPIQTIALGLRASTGDRSFPSSGWSTFSDDFRRDSFDIDRAFLNWQALDIAQLRFGIEANPLFTPTELLWDSDVQPAGIGQVINVGNTGLVIAAGQFMLREVRSSKAGNEENSFLFAQGVSYTVPAEAAKATAGASLYHFNNPDALARSLQGGELDGEFKTNRFDPRGRTLTDPRDPTKTIPTDYFSDFSILNFGTKIDLSRIPLSLVADVAINVDARKNASLGAAFEDRENLAVGGMVRYGRNKEAWDWLVGAGFFHIEADSVVAVYNSDDLQQTNVNSIPVELQLRLPGGVKLVWDTYIQEKVDTDLASNGGVVHGENATKVRTRLSVLGSF